MELLYLIIGLFAGAAAGYLFARYQLRDAPRPETLDQLRQDRDAARQEAASHQQALNEVREARSGLQSQVQTLEGQLQEYKEALEQVRGDYQAERDARLNLAAEKKTLQQHVDERKQELKDLREQMNQLLETTKTNLQNKVQELFQKNSETFKQASQEQLQQMLDPLNKQIKEFKDQTQKQHEKRLEENQTLVNKIQQLTELNQSVQSSAQELTKALRSDSKQQGDYGEMMLQQLFEAADLREGIHYDLQPSYKATQGEGQQQSVRPDCVVYLPKSPAGEERYAVVDSKVALTAYVDYINAEDATTAEQKLKEHTQAIKRHIDQLAQKQYHELPGSALAFTVLFIPNEGALLAALKQHYDLFAQAAQQRIVLVSPSTLMAMLRMIRSLWQQDDINKNAEAIAERAGKLYDKFVNLYETLEDLGKHLERSQASYDKALGQLRDGKGNLTRQVEQLSELGAKHDKRLPESARAALDAATEDDQADEGGRG